MRIKERKELREIALSLSKRLMDTQCSDMELLTQCDRLCRRTFGDVDGGWIRWAHYVETKIFGEDREKYNAWVKVNCEAIPLS